MPISSKKREGGRGRWGGGGREGRGRDGLGGREGGTDGRRGTDGVRERERERDEITRDYFQVPIGISGQPVSRQYPTLVCVHARVCVHDCLHVIWCNLQCVYM